MRSRTISLESLFLLSAVAATVLAHLGVLIFCHDRTVPANALQLISSILALAVCIRRAQLAPGKYFRNAWIKIAAAFALWAAAQGLFLASLLQEHRTPVYPLSAEILWFLFAFPLLMVTMTPRSKAKWEWVNWLDTAQACTFFFIVYALAFSRSSVLSVSLAYDVQSLALILACALRYASTPLGPERIFFRNLGGYLIVYGVLSCIGTELLAIGSTSSKWVDLCWSSSFLLFCVLVPLIQSDGSKQRRGEQNLKVGLPQRLKGFSALGLALMSISAGSVLESHRPLSGLVALCVAFWLFAIRTSARELQLHMTHDTLQHSVLHDALTGLANRTYLRRELAQRLTKTLSSGCRVGLLFIDLDRFKTINDGLGHAFGDQLLIEVARILSSSVGPEDFVVRLGGDEFVVLFECSEASDAQELANTLVQRLRQPISLGGRVLYATASVGVVLGDSGMQPDELLRDADCAMYVAKKHGKNQVQSFEHSMAVKANDELWLETDLREAIQSGGISIQYQPIYSLSGQAIVGFEALARWHHSSRGMVSPAEFIPVAEETGLIIELGKQVLREACQQTQQWNTLFHRNFTVSVNVSARQFSDPDLIETIGKALSDSGLSPALLKLEITESVLLSGVHAVEETLNSARALGVEISLDDFGTGYSSLSYLLRFPFDVVKIDRSFVQALDKNPKRAELAKTIVQLALNLGKKVIAEGVETEEEHERLREMRCDLLQGYLFSKPLAPDLIGRLLAHEVGLSSDKSPERKRDIWTIPKPAIGENSVLGSGRKWEHRQRSHRIAGLHP